MERIWSRNWWRNSDEEMRRIQQKIEEIRHSDNSIANEKSNITTSQSTIREILSTGINSLDIVTDWNEIARMILDRRQKNG